MIELMVVSLAVSLMFTVFMLVSTVKAQQKHLEGETDKYQAFVEKTLLAFKGEPAARAFALAAQSDESIRQHAQTYDLEAAHYAEILKKQKKQQEQRKEAESLMLLKDQHGNEIEITDLEND
jgi:hypothetical protein